MPALSHTRKIQLANRDAIVLCRAKDGAGRDFFHYVKADKSNLERMHRDYDTGDALDFASYGELLHSGWGEPSDADSDYVKAQWGEA